jgi:antitoxin component of MazEF toxin-antitoxin module
MRMRKPTQTGDVLAIILPNEVMKLLKLERGQRCLSPRRRKCSH